MAKRKRKKQKGKVETTKNYVVRDFRNPPKKEVIGYRTIRQGDHLIRVAILRGRGPRGGRTKVVSIWHPKTERTSKDSGVRRVLQRRRNRRRSRRR